MLKNLDTKIAISFGDKHITYSDLRRSISKFSESFELEQGGHAVIFAENSPEWIYAFYAIWYKKGIAIPLDNLATAEETAYILKDCHPEIIFSTYTKRGIIERAIAISGLQVRLIFLEEIKGYEDPEIRPVVFSVAEQEQTAVLIYTSGTTGNPKGVMLSYKNLLTNVRAVSEHIPIYRPESVVLMLLPAHHIFPLAGTVVIPLYIGATIAISPSMQSPDIITTLQKSAVTIIIGVPRLYAAIRKGIMDKINSSIIARLLFGLARKVDNKNFSKKIFGAVHKKLGGAIESLVSGGAALDKEIGNDFKTLGFEVLEGYGMTEAAPMITFTRPGRVKIGSPGEIMSETKVEIRDGEITASGPNIMKGYYNKPEDTNEILKDGWLYTGDLGYIDDEGFLFITGRKKEILVLSNGKNVNPSELEDKLLESPFVKDCGVFYHDDQLQAIIVPEINKTTIADTKQLDEIIRKEVIEPFNKTVSAYKKIMGFHITEEELPRTRLGKLQRFKLVSLAALSYIDHKENEPLIQDTLTPELKMIIHYLENEKSRNVLPRYHIEMDLGMDSLDLVSFQTWLMQTFGVNMEPSFILSFENIGKLGDFIAEKKTRVEESKVDWTEIIKEKVNLKLPANWFTGRWVIYAFKIFSFFYFRVKPKGTNRIPEAPVIFVPNHQSYFDSFFIASFLRRRQLKKTYFYAKEKHFRQAWLRFFASRNNIIVVDVNKELKQSIQKMAEVLKQKKNLIIFPEGTRSKTGGLGDFKKTFAILSRELNVPVVPVMIKGAYEALPTGSKFPRPLKKIRVEFLDPVYPGMHTYESLTDYVKNNIQSSLSSY